MKEMGKILQIKHVNIGINCVKKCKYRLKNVITLYWNLVKSYLSDFIYDIYKETESLK